MFLRKWNLSNCDAFALAERNWKQICRFSQWAPSCMGDMSDDPCPMETQSYPGIIWPKRLDTVTPSCSGVGTGGFRDFLERSNVHCWTTNIPFSWYRVDFGSNTKVLPTHYCLKYGSSGNYCVPRYWKLQGSNDPLVEIEPMNDSLWITLRDHVNDVTFNSDYAWFVFRLYNVREAFRYFRIIQTGKNVYVTQNYGGDSWSDVLVAAGFDLFGLCISLSPSTDLNQPKSTEQLLGKQQTIESTQR